MPTVNFARFLLAGLVASAAVHPSKAQAKGDEAKTAAGANPTTCAIFYGNAAPVAPATIEGQLTCQ